MKKRWYFGVGGSLEPLHERKSSIIKVHPSSLQQAQPATDCTFQKTLDRLSHQSPMFIEIQANQLQRMNGLSF
jgi:hypothetical protein